MTIYVFRENSGRATCRICKEKVGKDELSINFAVGSYMGKLNFGYIHYSCLHLREFGEVLSERKMRKLKQMKKKLELWRQL